MKQAFVLIIAFCICSSIFSQNPPESATFLKAYNILKPSIRDNFKDITGKLIGNTRYGSPMNAITIKNLPGTLTNYIEFMEADGYSDDTYYYMAPIDTTSSKNNIILKMMQWKQMLLKTFPEEAKSMKDETLAESQTVNFTFLDFAAKWTMSLRYFKENNKYKMSLMIENE